MIRILPRLRDLRLPGSAPRRFLFESREGMFGSVVPRWKPLTEASHAPVQSGGALGRVRALPRGWEGLPLITPRRSVSSLKVERLEPGLRRSVKDQVAVEEPLEIRVETAAAGRKWGRSVSVTMRTPGYDFELAAGFLFCEGVLRCRDQVREIAYCGGEEPQEYNRVSVRLREGVGLDPDLFARNFLMSSSCGVCGKASLEAVEVRGCEPLSSGSLRMEGSLLARLPDILRGGQAAFQRTGGLHAAGLFDAGGGLRILREDVGRHNAVDKVVGQAFLQGETPLHDRILVVSGRTSFEIMQKALVAEIPVVVAVGAPSSLAVDMARRFNMTLVGFVRGSGFNVYAGGERILDWEGVDE